jgi:hypothetical protein
MLPTIFARRSGVTIALYIFNLTFLSAALIEATTGCLLTSASIIDKVYDHRRYPDAQDRGDHHPYYCI